MNARDFSIIELRPQILSARIYPNMSTDEYFQNKVLRPVIKLQNELLLEVFKNYIKKFGSQKKKVQQLHFMN